MAAHPVPSRSASLEIERVVEVASAPGPEPVDRSGRAGAVRALPHPGERIDATRVAGERAEAVRLESQATREPTPHRALTPASARQPASHDGVAVDPQATPQPASIQVRIGSIALHVRTPPAPAPPAQAVPIAATPAVAEAPRAPAPPFAFSAQRHHLRWS